jgi:hypothetical protein
MDDEHREDQANAQADKEDLKAEAHEIQSTVTEAAQNNERTMRVGVSQPSGQLHFLSSRRLVGIL